MEESRVLALFESTGAVLRGHFQLSSGRHADTYMQAALVLQYPEHALALGRELAGFFSDAGVTAVVGPALGGIVLAAATAAGLDGARALFAEREAGLFTFRRGFGLGPEDRVLVVEDVITTGGSTAEVISLVEARGAVTAGVAALVDRSGGRPLPGFEARSLLRLPLDSWPAGECPLCRQGIPVNRPGSRPLPGS